MKFGKQLKYQTVSEWQEYYMSYKRLKRIIKKLCVQLKEKETKEDADRLRRSQQQHEQQMAQQGLQASGSPLIGHMSSSMGLNSLQPRHSPLLTRLASHLSNGGGGGGSNNATAALNNDSSDERSEDAQSGSGSAVMLITDARQEFFTVYEADIAKVNAFYTAKLLEVENEAKQLRDAIADVVPIVESEHDATASATATTAVPDVSSSHDRATDDALHALNDSHGSTAQQRRSAMSTGSSSSKNNNNSSYQSVSDLESQPLIARALTPTAVNTPALSQSRLKLLEQQSNDVLTLYQRCIQLKLYQQLNFEGLRKIIKKFSKYCGEELEEEYIQRLSAEEFSSPQNAERLSELCERVTNLFTQLNRARNMDVNQARSILKTVRLELEEPSENDLQEGANTSYLWIVLACALAAICYVLPIISHKELRAQKCLSLLSAITVLWVTEAVPFFVSSLAIPFLVVVSGILADETGVPLSAERAAKVAFGALFNDTVMLVLGGFSISAAFSKCQFELRLAAMIQRHCGAHPRVFLLAFMLLGCVLSMWISNVAAPVLLTTLLLPIVRDFGSKNQYARALLLGLAISCNIGGMTSPISSPQNAIALGYLEAEEPDYVITFTEWLKMSVPFCLALVLASWAYLVLVFLRNASDVPESIPAIVYEKSVFSRTHLLVCTVSLLTIGLWCSLSYTRPLFGAMGCVAVIPMVLFFGLGVLTKADLQQFSWHLILLIGGGNVLGAAVNSSRLLHLISQKVSVYLLGQSLYITVLAVLLLVFVITTFVSHTVAALILTPLIVSLGHSSGHVQVCVMLATLMMSGTQSLPMSSFPNVNSLLIDDDFNRPFLHPRDFLIHGSIVSTMTLGLLCTFGYGMALLIFGSAAD